MDASALLAFLAHESGWQQVQAALKNGALVSAANWSETIQKFSQRAGTFDLAGELLLSYGLKIEPVTEVDAVKAAELWQLRRDLSLGDRLCIALANRMHCTAMTSDSAWGTKLADVAITQIR